MQLSTSMAALSSHQDEATRKPPTRMGVPPLLEMVCLLPTLGCQGDTAVAVNHGQSTARHHSVLGVVSPGGGEMRHSAGEGDTIRAEDFN